MSIRCLSHLYLMKGLMKSPNKGVGQHPGRILGRILSTVAVVILCQFSNGTGAAEESPAGQLPLEDLRTFTDVFNHIRINYVENIDDHTLLENAIKGMLNGLDPHSTYLDAKTFEQLKTSTSGEFGGLGLEVGMEDGFVRVIAPIDDTPAHRAGIESGDFIIKLDGKPVKGKSLNEAVSIMRGPKGSEIELTIAREGVPQPFVLKLVRDIIKVRSIRSRMVEPDYVYLRIAQFQTTTGKDFKNELTKIINENPSLKGMVIDLRNNPGGILQASVEVADALLEEGLIVYTEGRIANAKISFSATPEDLTKGLPIVVLINGGSASASEIVAGALQDHNRAIILGTQSFGKGSVQTVLPLSEKHAIKLTTARYYTPKGRSIQAEGITPDINLERAKITALAPRASISEKDLSGHLDNPNGSSGNSQGKKSQELAEGASITSDNQLYEALNLLKGIHILSLK